MSIYISMLRGINVGGQKKLPMETLRAIYEKLGFTNVRSYVQSGNLVFESPVKEINTLVKQIEEAIQAASGYQVPAFIRQAHELHQILEQNPFLSPKNEDTSTLYVTFLYSSPPDASWSKMVAPAGSVDEFARGDLAICLFCPHGYGKTKLSNSFFERKLGVLTTTRNWNTVNALYRMAEEKGL